MPTSHYVFRALVLTDQLQAVWNEATFIMTRYEEEDAVNLYHMPARFFVETFFDQFTSNLYRTNTFTSAEYWDGHYATCSCHPRC